MAFARTNCMRSPWALRTPSVTWTFGITCEHSPQRRPHIRHSSKAWQSAALMKSLTPLLCACAALTVAGAPARSQYAQDVPPPGQLIDIGGYKLHLWCTGPMTAGRPTVVLSIGAGGFAVDWALVQRPLADSNRVCSYDRPGYGWSDPGPSPRTLRQEAAELRTALERAGERPPYVVVGQSLGALAVRQFAQNHRSEVSGMVLVGATNENGRFGYRGQFVRLRTLASGKPIPAVRKLTDAPPERLPAAESDSCRTRAERTARIVRPFDQLGAQAQRYRIWALQHPACVAFQDDMLIDELAALFNGRTTERRVLGDLPLTLVYGTQGLIVPPGVDEQDLRRDVDSLRSNYASLSRRGRIVLDTLSGHHTQLDHPALVVSLIREMLRSIP